MLRLKTKDQLRFLFKEKRGSLSFERRREARELLIKNLHSKLASYKKVISFASFGDEIDLWELNQLLSSQKKLLLPRLEKYGIKFYEVQSLDNLILSKYGILEPDPNLCSDCFLEQEICALIPALGFDKNFHRLGYGKGYFDRWVAEHPNIFTIGIGFKEQLSEELLPIEAHDKSLRQIFLF